jgi:hypothetical protein
MFNSYVDIAIKLRVIEFSIMTLLFQIKIDWLVKCKMGHAEKEKQQDTIDLHA